MVRNGYATSSDAGAVLSRPLRLATGTVLPPLGEVRLAPGAPFDWGELTLALLLLGLALAAAQVAPKIEPTAVVWSRLLRLGTIPLAIGALFAAAHSIQVI